jgi:3-oxoacyl-[acyl-carrier-protein] synthase-3
VFVLNLASGSGRDVLEFFEKNKPENTFIDCVDRDFEAVQFALRLNTRFAEYVRMIPANVFRLRLRKRYHLVWSAGLFDYLDDAAFVRLLRRCIGWCEAGGEVIVGNFASANPTRPYMELMADWRLHHRSSEELVSLAVAAGASPGQVSVDREAEGVNLFLRIKSGPGRMAAAQGASVRRSAVVATGSCIPDRVVQNAAFDGCEFYDRQGRRVPSTGRALGARFAEITGILERRYAEPDQKTSDLAARAAERALAAAGIDAESVDGILLAHNWGDVGADGVPDTLPNLAARVKHRLGIKNPACVAYDVVAGCVGWLHALAQADAFVRLGQMRTVLVLGADTASRVVDPADVDSLLFADGAGAAIVGPNDGEGGLLAHCSMSYCHEDLALLRMGEGYHPDEPKPGRRYLKMNGHDVFKFAVQMVPPLILSTLSRARIELTEVSKVLVHQANERMIRAIVDRAAKLGGLPRLGDHVLPISVRSLGNSSVATIPTLWDLLSRNGLDGQRLHGGDVIVLVGVGAGMHATCAVYQVP